MLTNYKDVDNYEINVHFNNCYDWFNYKSNPPTDTILTMSFYYKGTFEDWIQFKDGKYRCYGGIGMTPKAFCKDKYCKKLVSILSAKGIKLLNYTTVE